MQTQTPPWYVLTGGPCAGKTTTILELKKRGYPVLDEAARLIIEEGLAAGKSLDEIRSGDWLDQVVLRKYDMERSVPETETYFFDRGIPDSVAYYTLSKLPVPQILTDAMRAVRYRKVFLLDLIEFRTDEARNETPEQAMLIHGLLREAYVNEGYEVVEVPVMNVEKRAEFILERL